jgi:hypothetical protein
MIRALTTERIFPMGNYANIKFAHTLSEIPEKVALNPKSMELLQYLILLDVEYAYKRYHMLMDKTTNMKLDEILEYIEAERQSTFEELINQTKE